MIRVVVENTIVSGSRERIDTATDAVMESLLTMPEILDPDIAVALDTRKIEVSIIVDTLDPLAAVEIATRALGTAYRVANMGPMPEARVFMHESLLGAETTTRTELVPA